GEKRGEHLQHGARLTGSEVDHPGEQPPHGRSAWLGGAMVIKCAVMAGAAEGNLEGDVQNGQLRMGVLVFAGALALGVLLFQAGLGASARSVVFLPLFGGIYGICGGLYRTCTVCAVMGVRKTEAGVEPVADKSVRRALLRRGAQIVTVSAVLATV